MSALSNLSTWLRRFYDRLSAPAILLGDKGSHWFEKAKCSKFGTTCEFKNLKLPMGLTTLEDRVTPATFYVSPTGNDANPGTALLPFRTVQQGINQAAAASDGNDIVNVAGGIYSTVGVDERFDVPSSANLDNLQLLGGWDPAFTVRDASMTPTLYTFTNSPALNRYDLQILDNDVTVDGFTLFSNFTAPRDADNVLVQSQNVTISNNILHTGERSGGSRPVGIATSSADTSGLQILDNVLNINAGVPSSTTAAIGIFLNPSAQLGAIKVDGNTFNGNNMNSAVIVSGVNNVTVQNNTVNRNTPVFGNIIELRVGGGSINNVSVLDNSITDMSPSVANSLGIAVATFGANPATNITIRGNQVAMLNNWAFFTGASAVTGSMVVERNSFDSTLAGGIGLIETTGFDISGNWLGSSSPATIETAFTIVGAGTVVARSLLSSNADSNPAAPGLQLPAGTKMLVPQTAATSGLTKVDGRIQSGIDRAASGMTVEVAADTYSEDVDASGNAVNIAPGASPGQVIVNGNYTLTSNDTLTLEINGTNPLTQFDNFIVNGGIDLGLANLVVTGPHIPAPGNSFTIFDNDLADSVTSTFNGLIEGSTLFFNGGYLSLTYAGGAGSNNIVLNYLAPPTATYVGETGDFAITNDVAPAGLSTGDTVNWNVGGTQHPQGQVNNLVFGYSAFTSINSAITVVTSAGTVYVQAGTYTENVVVNKQVILSGAQTGVDARGRVASEAIITPLVPANKTLELQTGGASSTIDGFTFSGGFRGIESTSGPQNNLQVLNNRFVGFTGSAVFFNDNGIDMTVNQNVFDGSSQVGTGAVFHMDTDAAHGLYFTNNWVVNGGASNTGFFVDGNHNIGPSGLRTPLISGNLISGNQTGMNLGTRAFGSQFTPNAGTISNNVFTNNDFDGLQGGMQNALIFRNTFSNNGRSGLALTSFGNMGADRGAQNTDITENFFSNNAIEDVFFSASQPAGTIATNKLFNNSLTSSKAVTYNGTETIQASGNWWGTPTNPETAVKIGGTGAANVDYTPWLNSGTDTDLGTAGFQGDFSFLHVSAASPQSAFKSAGAGRIQEAINLIVDESLVGGARRVDAEAGTYTENVLVDRALMLLGPNDTINPVTMPGSRVAEAVVDGTGSPAITVTAAAPVAIKGFEIIGTAQGIIDPGADLLIQNNIIDTAGTAVDVSAANSATILDNDITSTLGDGVFGQLVSSFVTVQGNEIDAAGYGVYLGDVTGTVTVGGLTAGQGNKITASGGFSTGVSIFDVLSSAVISGNTIKAGFGGIYTGTISGDLTVQSNQIGTYLGFYGIAIYDVGGKATIGGTGVGEGNTVADQLNGIIVNGTDSVAIQGNIVTGSSIGVLVDDVGSLGNPAVISGNNFNAGTDNITDISLPTTAGFVDIGAGNLFGGTDYFVYNDSPMAFDLTSYSAANFEGLNPATLADAFRIEDLLYHKTDNIASGLIRVNANQIYVTTPGTGANDETIQGGVNAAVGGDTIHVEAGTFVENVKVGTPVTIVGAGQGMTVVVPANADPEVISETVTGSLGGTPSNVFLVQANNVTISELTIDGNNPALVSGIIRGGQDIDARNGIITDHNMGTFNGLNVHDVTVQNVYLRGIYASSGGTFVIDNNIVQNVRGSFASIGIFNWVGAGTISNNFVTDCNDAISANHSSGTLFTNNVVTNSDSGIHTDNMGDGGGVADTIQFNSVSAGTGVTSYGIFVFGAYLPVVVDQNTVSDVDVGLGVFGSFNPVTVSLTKNDVDLTGHVGSLGVWVSTTLFGFGSANVKASITNDNSITGAGTGIFVEQEPGLFTAEVTISNNSASIFGNIIGIDVNAGSATITNNHIYDNTTGIRFTNGGTGQVGDGTLAGGNDFDGGVDPDNGTDIRLDNTAGAVAINDGNQFAGDNYFIDNQSSQAFDFTAYTLVSYEGLNEAVLFDNFRIEDKMFHQVDNGTSGLIRWNAGQIYVTEPGTGANNETIQGGVNAASSGDTVTVEKGTFNEFVTIPTSLNLIGPNVGIVGNGARVPEAIVQAPGVGAALIEVNANDVTIDGFTIDGDDLAFRGVRVNEKNNAVVQNNIVTGAVRGVQFNGPYVGSTTGGVVSSNKIHALTIDMVNNSFGVLGFFAAYVAVTNNVMTGLDVGVFEQYYYYANGGLNPDNVVSGNTITAAVLGYGTNERSNAAATTALSNNIMTIGAGGLGYQFFNIYKTGGITLTNETVMGGADGVYAFINGGSVSITNSSFSTMSGSTGLFLTNYLAPYTYPANVGDGKVTISGTTFSGYGTGVALEDHPMGLNGVELNVGAGNSITGGATGLQVTGGDTTITGNTFNNLAFTAQSGQYIKLADGALDNTEIDATAATFMGMTGAARTINQNFTLENRITHSIDRADTGFIRVHAGNVYTTQNSFDAPFTTSADIQRAIDSAVDQDNVHIQTGNYVGTIDTTAMGLGVNLSPAASPGQVFNAGNMTLDSNDTVSVEINSNVAGPVAGFDNFVVTGSADIGGAALALTGTYAFQPLDTLEVIDASTGLTGAFAGYPDGFQFFFNLTPVVAQYLGSPDFDFVLAFDSDPIINATNGGDDIVIRRQAAPDNIQVLINNVIVMDAGYAGLTSLTVNGLDGNDTFTVQYGYTGGYFELPLFLNGDAPAIAPGDRLNILAGTFDAITGNYTNANDGNFVMDPTVGGNSTISYTGLEPAKIHVVSVADMTLNLPNDANDAKIDVGAVAGDGLSRLLSNNATFESTDFTTPFNSLTVNAQDGADTIDVNGLDLGASQFEVEANGVTYLGLPAMLSGGQNVDGGGWNLNPSGTVPNATTRPHVSVSGTGDGTFDWYSFTVNVAGSKGSFGTDTGNFDTEIFLFDSQGKFLIGDDDGGPGNLSLITDFVFTTPGVYFLAVGEWNSIGNNFPVGLTGDTPDVGDAYTLFFSLENHALVAGADPIAEVEDNSVTFTPPPPGMLSGGQDVDNNAWSLFPSVNIANDTTRPHTTIIGTGDGTYDFYSFTVSVAGSKGTFDIDFNTFDTELFLFDSTGKLLAFNDDGAPADIGDAIFSSRIDDFVFANPGTYFIGVAQYDSSGGDFPIGITGPTAPVGGLYYLHISLENHGLNAMTIAPAVNINGGQGADFIAFSATSLPSSLTVNGDAGDDTANVGTLTTGSVGNPGHVSVTTETVVLAGDLTATNSANITVTAVNSFTVPMLTADNTVTLTASAGAITDGNGATNNVTAAALAVNGATGVGSIVDALETDANNLEAQTTTGDIAISNTGDVTIGGVNGTLAGIQTKTSGSIQIVNAGSIFVGLLGQHVRSKVGDVVLQTSTATGDIIVGGTGSYYANGNVRAFAGKLTMNAGRDVTLGYGGYAGDSGASGDVVVSAQRHVTVQDYTWLFSTAGNLTISSGLSGTGNVSIIKGAVEGSLVFTLAGTIGITTAPGGVFTSSAAPFGMNPSGVVAFGNNAVTINADDMVITAGLIGSNTGNVILQQVTAGTAINFGGVGGLNLSDAELDRVVAGLLRIGNAASGAITFNEDLDFTDGPVVPTVHLTSGSTITGTAGGIKTASLALSAAGTVNMTDTTTAVSNLAIFTSVGDITFVNQGALTITTVDGVTGVSGPGFADISAASPLTVAANVILGGNVTLTAGEIADFPACADDLTVNAGVKVQSTGGDVSLRAGDDVIIQGGATVQATGNVFLTAGFGDLDMCGDLILNGTIITGNNLDLCAMTLISLGSSITAPGTVTIFSMLGSIVDGNVGVDVTAAALAMKAATGVGTLADPIESSVSNLEGQVTGTGGFFVDNSGKAMTIGGIATVGCGIVSLTGISTANGDIRVTNANAMTVGETVSGAGVGGDVTLEANLAGLAAGNFSGLSVEGGNVTTTDGDINLSGKGGNTGTLNHGVRVINGKQVNAGGTGEVTIVGTGGSSTGSTNIGVLIDGVGTLVTSATKVNITGTGGGSGASGTNRGVGIQTSAQVTATGTGSIDIIGFGGTTATGTSNRGVFVVTGGVVSTVSGDISIEGTGGGSGASTFDRGVYFQSAGTLISAGGAGNLTVVGIGGTGTGGNSEGIWINTGPVVSTVDGLLKLDGTANGGGTAASSGIVATGAGTQIKSTGLGGIEMIGTGAVNTATGNRGVVLAAATVVSTVSGDIDIMGFAGGNGTAGQSRGVYVGGTGTAVNAGGAGNLTITGFGGGGTGTSSQGIRITVNAQLSAVDGDITLIGTGGGTGATSTFGIGVYFVTGTGATVTGTGNIYVTGNSSSAAFGGSNDGVRLLSTKLSTASGDIELDGTSHATGGSTNYGVYIRSSSTITVGGTGQFSAIGVGGPSIGNFNGGVGVVNSSISTNSGDASFDGTAGGAGVSGFSYGVWFNTAIVTVGGAGQLDIVGQGGVGTTGDNYGVFIEDVSKVTTSTGDINITGTEGVGPNSVGFRHQDAGTFIKSTAGNITVNANSMDLGAGTSINAGANTVSLFQLTNGVGFDLGAGTDTVGGPVALSDAELDTITAGLLLIGNANTGAVVVSADIDLTATETVSNLHVTSGSTITGTAGGIKVDNLALSADDAVNFTDTSSDVDELAIVTTNDNATFVDSDGLNIGTVDGVNGVQIGAGIFSLTAGGAVTQSQKIIAAGLELLGAGSFTLTNVNNDVDNIAGNTGGFVDYVDADDLNVGTVNTAGLTSAADVTLKALTSNLTITTSVNAAGFTATLTSVAGSIIDANAGANNITALSAALSASTGIDADTALTNLAAFSTSGNINIDNIGALNITTVGSLTGVSGGGSATITTASPMNVNANVIMAGSILLEAKGVSDFPVCADDVNINAGVLVQSTGGNVTVFAEDDIFLAGSATIQAFGTVTLEAAHNDSGDMCGGLTLLGTIISGGALNLCAADDLVVGTLSATGTVSLRSMNGQIIDGNGAGVNVTAPALGMGAKTGIGVGDALETVVSVIEAETATGGIFVDNTSASLTVGDIMPLGCMLVLTGVRATTSGDIALTNTGSINVTTTGQDIEAAGGSISLQTSLISGDIVTGNGTAYGNVYAYVDLKMLSAGNVILGAGNKYGDSYAITGNATISAAGNIVVDSFTFVTTGGGDMFLTAGGNVSIDNNFKNNSRVASFGGDIFITTGAGGVFTLDTGANGVFTVGGNLTVTADDMDIASGTLSAGTGTALFQQVTPGTAINFGGVGGLNLTDAELDRVTAALLRIGNANSGAMTFNQDISLASAKVPTLKLTTPSTITGTAGGIQVQNLAIDAGSTVNFTDTDSDVDNLAIATTNDNATFRDADGLNIGTVDGIVGVNVGGGNFSLTAGGAVTQSDAIFGVGLELLGAGPFTLTLVNNDVDNIAGNSTGAVNYVDADDLNVGTVNTGGLTSAADVTLTALTSNLTITSFVTATGSTATLTATAGSIVDGNAGANNITALSAALKASTGIDADTVLTNLAAFSTGGNITIDNIGTLNITTVGALTGVSGGGSATITTASPMNVNADVIMGGAVYLEAKGVSDFPICADDVNINAGVLVRSLGGDVTIYAEDDIFLAGSATIQANGNVILEAAHNDSGDMCGALILLGTIISGGNIELCAADDISVGAFTSTGGTITVRSKNGAIIDGNGPAMNLTAPAVALSAKTGVASFLDFLETNTANIEAETQTGGIFVDNASAALIVGGVTPGCMLVALNGYTASVSGDVHLKTAGTLLVNEQVATASGNADLNATAMDLVARVAASGVATLNATAGAISDGSDSVPNTEVQANVLMATATGGIELDTAVNTMTVMAGGPVTLRELDGVIVNSITAAGNLIELASTDGSSTFTLFPGNAIDDASTVDVFLGTDLDLNGDNETIGALQGAGKVVLPGQTLTTGGNGASTLFSGVISGASGNVIKVGAGTMTMSGSNTYSGTTSILDGVLALGANNVLSDLSSLVVNGASATFAMTTFNDTVMAVSLINGSITGTGGTLTSKTDFDVRNGLASANLAGTVGLIKITAGTVELSGSNIYTGNTMINGGVLNYSGSLTGLGGDVFLNANGVVLDGKGTGVITGRGVQVVAGKTNTFVQNLATVTKGATQTGLTINTGASATVRGNSIQNNQIGVLVDGGTALIESNNLSNNNLGNPNLAAGLVAQNGAIVDAGQSIVATKYYTHFTGLAGGTGPAGASAGLNTFLGYPVAGVNDWQPNVPKAIRNNNVGGTYGKVGPQFGVFDLTAMENTFDGTPNLFLIEKAIYHDVDDFNRGFVSYGSVGASTPATLTDLRYYAYDPNATYGPDIDDFTIITSKSPTGKFQASSIRRLQGTFDGFVFLDNTTPTAVLPTGSPVASTGALQLYKNNGPALTSSNTSGFVNINTLSAFYDQNTGAYTLTWGFSNPPLQYLVEPNGSLTDGNYQLALNGALIQGGGPGGDALTNPGPVRNFHRFFGDHNGDRRVDNVDLKAFNASLGGTLMPLTSNWRGYFNYDTVNVITSADFSAFNRRYKQMLNTNGTTSPIPYSDLGGS